MNTGIDEQTQKKIVAIINAIIPEASIYLFGSRARGTHSKWSDIDIALSTDQPISYMVTGELMSLFEASHLPYKVQVVDVNSVSDTMKKNILKDKIIWKE